MVNGIGKFNNEERILLNNICKDESLTKLTKEDVKTSLMISREIVNDDLMVELIDDLLDTLKKYAGTGMETDKNVASISGC